MANDWLNISMHLPSKCALTFATGMTICFTLPHCDAQGEEHKYTPESLLNKLQCVFTLISNFTVKKIVVVYLKDQF